MPSRQPFKKFGVRKGFSEAKQRGLKNRETADEFNRRAIPRVGRRRWTADAVRQRRIQLKRRRRMLAERAGTDAGEQSQRLHESGPPNGDTAGAVVEASCGSISTSTSLPN